MEARLIPSEEIDKKKWDALVALQENGLIYSTSAYLDAMAENWTGIVFGDYEILMPIPWKKKYGIKYCYHVPFIQQLGFFGNEKSNQNKSIINLLNTFVKYGDYNFNFINNLEFCNPKIEHRNDILLLTNYEEIVKKYSKDLVSNLKKSMSQKLILSEGSIDSAIDFYIELYKQRTPHVSQKDYENFRLLCKQFEKNGNAFVKLIKDERDEIHAIGLFLKDSKRIYNLANSTTQAGRKSSANHLLFDRIINENCGKNLILDFEGSDIESIASFYKNFGSISQPFYSIHLNKLPYPLNLFKR